jgi:hypothetical protein
LAHTVRLATCLPLGVKRYSASRPRLPITASLM